MTKVAHIMGTEHALATSCPVFVHAILHGEWMRARRRLYGPVYISSSGTAPAINSPVHADL